MSDVGAFVHETAMVEDGVSLGDGTYVWHLCHLRTGASIGVEVSLGKSVFVDVDVTVGDRVRAQADVYLPRGVVVHDDVFLGPKATFTNDVYPRAFGEWEVTPTVVGKGASVGANVSVVAGCHLGAYCVVGAGSVVTRPVAPFELVAGNPARRLGWVDRRGRVVLRGDVDPPSTGDAAAWVREHG